MPALHKGCLYKVGQFQLCKDWRFWLRACTYVSATDDSKASFEHCGVVLVVSHYSARCNATRKKIIIISNYIPTGCNKCLVCNGFYCSRLVGKHHHNTVRGVTFPSHAWGIRTITTHRIAGQSEHASILRTMSFVKINAFQKGRA